MRLGKGVRRGCGNQEPKPDREQNRSERQQYLRPNVADVVSYQEKRQPYERKNSACLDRAQDTVERMILLDRR